jgi:hypothetical protein
MIGHTQPRRIAARTVAERVAEELRTPLGEAVGWKVRFTDQVNPDATFIKLMTDGILLAEIQTDRELRAYDTIIIDEPTSGPSTSTSCSGIWRSCCPSGPISRSSSRPRPLIRSGSPGISGTRRSSRSAGGRIRWRCGTGRCSRRIPRTPTGIRSPRSRTPSRS